MNMSAIDYGLRILRNSESIIRIPDEWLRCTAVFDAVWMSHLRCALKPGHAGAHCYAPEF